MRSSGICVNVPSLIKVSKIAGGSYQRRRISAALSSSHKKGIMRGQMRGKELIWMRGER